MWREISLRDWIIMSQLQIKLTGVPAKLLTFPLDIKVGNTFQGSMFAFFFFLYTAVRQPLQNRTCVNKLNCSPISHIK